MKKIAYVIVVLGLLVTGGLGFSSLSQPLTATAAGLLGWAVSPYPFLLFLLGRQHERVHAVMVALLAIAVSVFGMAMLVDAFYVHPDAQAGLVFLVAPLWQWGGILLGGIYRLAARIVAGRRVPGAGGAARRGADDD